MSDYVVPWADVIAYMKERRENVILDLAKAEDLRGLYHAQGKLALLDELCNLHGILAALDSVKKEDKHGESDTHSNHSRRADRR